MHIDQPIADMPKPADVRPQPEAPAGGSASERLRSGHIGHELAGLATAAAAMHLAEQIRQSLLGGGRTGDHRAAMTPSHGASHDDIRSVESREARR